MDNIKKNEPKVRLFTTVSCPYCYTLKAFLKEKNVSFEDIDVSQDEKVKDELVEKTGQLSVPIIEIDGQFIVGFDKAKICKLLKIS